MIRTRNAVSEKHNELMTWADKHGATVRNALLLAYFRHGRRSEASCYIAEFIEEHGPEARAIIDELLVDRPATMEVRR